MAAVSLDTSHRGNGIFDFKGIDTAFMMGMVKGLLGIIFTWHFSVEFGLVGGKHWAI